MLKRIGLAVLILVGFGTATHADTQPVTFDFSVTGQGISLSGVITADFVETIETYGGYITDWEVSTMSGTFNGSPIVTPVPGFGDFNGGDIGEIFGVFDTFVPSTFFLADGQVVFWEYVPGQSPLTEVIVGNNIVPVTSVITDPAGPIEIPEPNALILTLTGILVLLVCYRLKRRHEATS